MASNVELFQKHRLHVASLIIFALAGLRIAYTLKTGFITYDEALYMSAGHFTAIYGHLYFTYGERQLWQLLLTPFAYAGVNTQIVLSVLLSAALGSGSLILMDSIRKKLNIDSKYFPWIFLLAPSFVLASATVLTEGIALFLFFVSIRLLMSERMFTRALAILPAIGTYNVKEPYGVLVVAIPIYLLTRKDLKIGERIFSSFITGVIGIGFVAQDAAGRFLGFKYTLYGALFNTTGQTFANRSLGFQPPELYGVVSIPPVLLVIELFVLMIFLGLGIGILFITLFPWRLKGIFRFTGIVSLLMVLGMAFYVSIFTFYQINPWQSYWLILLRFGSVSVPYLFVSLCKPKSTKPS